MARDVSPEICRALGENLNCDIVYGSDNTTVVSFGNITERGFQGDPDIAGIGVGPSLPPKLFFPTNQTMISRFLGLSSSLLSFLFYSRLGTRRGGFPRMSSAGKVGSHISKSCAPASIPGQRPN